MKMITPSVETQNPTRRVPENRPARETRLPAEGHGHRNLRNTPAKDLTEVVKLLKDELDTVRREHAKLQQAIYEAAQTQRRLCAPRDGGG